MITIESETLFAELLSRWQPFASLTDPPPSSIELWARGQCRVSIGDSWGPPIGYAPHDHRDGTMNYGYVSAKGDPEAVRRIPETLDYPELAEFLITTNAQSSPLESAGCEKCFFPASHGSGDATTYIGSYVDVIFTEASLNDRPENHLLLAGRLIPSVAECEGWWGAVTLELVRYKSVPGTQLPWGLMVHITNHGRTKDEARKYWGETLRRLGATIAELPTDFKWNR